MRYVILILALLAAGGGEAYAGDQAQKRILLERGEKVTGARLELVRRVIESYRDCRVSSEGNTLTGLTLNGKSYRDFTLVIREAKKTIIVVTVDGVVSFDY